MADKIGGGEELRPQSPLLKKLENFWYHYKWHTILSVFALVVALVCILQMCGRDRVDLQLLYGGSMALEGEQIQKMESTMCGLIDDYDQNGERKVSLHQYYVLAGSDREGASAGQLQYSSENRSAFDTEMQAGEAMFCLLSSELYFDVYRACYDAAQNRSAFCDLREITKGHAEVRYLTDSNGLPTDSAILLKSTPLGSLAGFADLPDDTVICLRRPPVVGNPDELAESLRRAEDTLRRILAVQ